MNYILVILVLVIQVMPGIICRIIFQDEFDEFDQLKWKAIEKKADCANILPLKYTGCSTSNLVNLRTTSSVLAITARQENYFNSQTTTATVVSQESFLLGPKSFKLFFKMRASLPEIPGLTPRIDLSPLNFYFGNLGNLENIHLVELNGTISKEMKNLSHNIAASEFNEYVITYDHGIFSWLVNNILVRQQHFSPSSLSPFAEPYPYKIIITVEVDNKIFSSSKTENKSCVSFLIDYISVYQDEIKDSFTPDSNDFSSNEICNQIKSLEEQAYIKFKPENYSYLIFEDEFDGNVLDENKWIIRGFNLEDHNKVRKYVDQRSCEIGDHRNIEVNGGKLKLFVREENYAVCNFTGAYIRMNALFNRARIEIRAKLPREKYLASELFLENHNKSSTQKRQDGYLALFANYGCDTCLVSGFQENEYSYFMENLKNTKHYFGIYQVYGIEWTKKSIVWFINDQVVHQVNLRFEQSGRSNLHQRSPLPFDHPFSLSMISALQVNENGNKQDKIDISNWTTNYLEIDYIRVYGEEPYSIENSKESYQTPTPYTLIISINMVILIIVIIIITVYLKRRADLRIQNEVAKIDAYDDIELHDNKYEEIQEYRVDNEYDQANYYDTVGNIPQDPSDYLTLVDYKNV